MTDAERRARLIAGLERSGERIEGVLARWHEYDDDLREHYADELAWLLETAARLLWEQEAATPTAPPPALPARRAAESPR
jgi:hypothetical protein